MTHEEKCIQVGQWLQKFLQRYNVPEGMDKAALKSEMIYIVEDVVSVTPSHWPDMQTFCRQVEMHLRGSHGNRTWPTIKQFLMAARAAVEDTNRIHQPTKSGTDMYRIIEMRMMKGEPVPVDYLTGQRAANLIERTSITRDQIDAYMNSFNKEYEQLYGKPFDYVALVQ